TGCRLLTADARSRGVVEPPPEQAPLEQRESDDQREEDHDGGGRLAELEVLKSLLVYVVDVDHGRRHRSALRHDADDVEALEARDRERDEEEERGRREEWPRDVAKTTPSVGAIERGGVVEVTWDGLKTCEVDHQRVAHRLPHRHEHERPERD